MVLVEKLPFFPLLLCIIGQENVFDDILERKNVFLGYKNKNFKKSKNRLFSKGLVHCFGQKVKMLPCFCFSQIKAKNMFDNILETKKCFQDNKNEKFKK